VSPRRNGFRASELVVKERGQELERKVPDLAHPS